jgi:hypothetical protein
MNKELGEGQGVDQTKCATEIQSTEPRQEIVRVLRVIEYSGPRDRVEEIVSRSLHGQRTLGCGKRQVTIRAVTVGLYPEILRSEEGMKVDERWGGTP